MLFRSTATSDVLESGVAENNDLVDRLHAMNQSVGIMLVMEKPTASGAAMMAQAQLGDVEKLIRTGQREAAFIALAKARGSVASAYKSSGDLIDTAFWFGTFAQAAGYTPETVASVTRNDVKRVLRVGPGTGTVDARVWQAIVQGYGEGADRKGGRLHGVKSHARQALAAAIAWVQINRWN